MSRRLVALKGAPEAEAWARQFFMKLHTRPDPIIGVHWLTKEGSRRACCDLLKHAAEIDPLRMIATVQEAEAGWDLADQALREIFAERLERRDPLPTSLATYIQKAALANARPKIASTQKGDRWLRDMAMTYAVEEIAKRFGLPMEGTRGSACSIVSLAMRGTGGPLTPNAVKKVWKRYSPWLHRLGMAALIQRVSEEKLTA